MNTIFFHSNINSSDTLMKIIYWFGLFACMASGYNKGCSFYRFPVLHWILNSFAGGLSRDILCLHCKVWFFSNEAIMDILYVISLGFIYSVFIEKIAYSPITILNNRVITFIDAVSLGSFISLGADKAISLGYGTSVAIVSAYLTSTLGGVVANYLRPNNIFTISNLYYHLVVFIGCIIYCHYPNGYLVCVIIPLGLLIHAINYYAIIADSQMLCSKLGIYIQLPINSSYYNNEHCLYRHNRNEFHNNINSIIELQQLFITLHRIRIC